MSKILGALGVLILVSACGAAQVGQAGPSVQPVASPTPTAITSPAASPSSANATPTPAASPVATAPAGFLAQDASGGSVAMSNVTTVRVGQQAGYDRFVIEFSGGIPAYTITRQATPSFTRSPRGDQVTLQGTAGVLIVVHSIGNWTSYAGPTTFQPGYPYLRQALQVENFEGYQQWGLGVQGTPYIRVMTLTSPDRLVVDVCGI